MLEKYGEIGYRNYLTKEFYLRYGCPLLPLQVSGKSHWAYTNVCPKSISLGLPWRRRASSGNWDDWTLLGSIDNSTSTLADFAAEMSWVPKQGAKG